MKQLTLILLLTTFYSYSQNNTCEEFYIIADKFIESSETVLTKEYGDDPYEGFINTLKSLTSEEEYLSEIEKIYKIDSILRTQIREHNEVYHKIFMINDSEGLLVSYLDFNSITTFSIQCIVHDPPTASYLDVVSNCGALCPSLIGGTTYWIVSKTSDSRTKFLFLSHIAIIANGQLRESLRNNK